MIEGLPILDAHIHLDPDGANRQAVRRFLDIGGTHLLIIHKPYHNIRIRDIEDYKKAFETTINMCEMARKEGAISWCFVGPYPGELPQLAKDIGFNEAFDLQTQAVEEGLRLVEEGKALGIGEVGRIHFDIESKFQEACDEILHHVFRGARGIDCPVVLHTESYHSNPELMKDLARSIDQSSIKRERVVKHYSGQDLIDPVDNLGISISLQCRKETVKKLLSTQNDHLLETDFIDDPFRPNLVMPPETVPKKILWAYEQGLLERERHSRLMIDLPRKIFNIDTDR